MTFQQVLAAIGFVLCVALLVHHGLGARQQARFALWWRAHAARLRGAWQQWRQPKPRGPRGRQASDLAEREAADLIERAKRSADRTGNVIRPHRFGGRSEDERPRRDLH